MRFYEIATPRLKVLGTKRFVKDAAFYARGYPAVEKTLHDFIEFKVANPREQFGKKDAPFTGGPLTGTSHVHLVHGKVVLVYDIKDGALRLFDVVEHNSFERSGVIAMAKYIAAATLDPMATASTTEALPADAKAELDELFYEIAVQERDVIDSAIGGDWPHLFDYIRMVVDEETASDETIFSAYGGKDGLVKFLSGVLRNLGYK